ncbi:class I SAM-dependent methyltransferase [Actinoplanes sp. NPDC051411]|uniref:class I SAM-dependent methyltransferase n=1 Tax=Actinoplanes sp. NPDC051411 TaxID=3155522 RepID=UPI0034372471
MRRALRYAKRLSGLSVRQLAGLLGGVVICAGVAVAAMIGQAAVATCLLALLLAGAVAGVIHLSRRIGGVQRATQDSVRDLRLVVEQVQRRVLASVERERLAAGDRHLELTEALARTERLTGRGAELLLREQSREIEALVQLFQRVTPRAPMPAGAALQPTDLLGLVHVAATRQPGLTVVLGSGPSTIWLGYALEGGDRRLIAVDHDEARAAGTRATLAAHGLTAVEVRHAALAELRVDGKPVDWYDVDALDGLQDIDLLVVDGTVAPGADALAPALHVLGRRLASGAAVVVDEVPAPSVAPRQGGGFPLTAQRRLAGRWTTLTYGTAVPAGRSG